MSDGLPERLLEHGSTHSDSKDLLFLAAIELEVARIYAEKWREAARQHGAARNETLLLDSFPWEDSDNGMGQGVIT